MLRIGFASCLIAVLSLVSVGFVKGDEPFVAQKDVTNAALQYWHAFATLPNYTAEEVERLHLAARDELPLDEIAELVERARPALALIEKVDPATDCRWEIVVDDGPLMLMPHLNRALLAGRLLGLRVRLDAAEGDEVGAVKGLAGMLVLSRNVDEGTLLQLLHASAVEVLAMDTSGKVAGRLTDETRGWLLERLAQLPERSTFADAIGHERDVFGEWLERTMRLEPKEIRERFQAVWGDPVGMEEGGASVAVFGVADEPLEKRLKLAAEFKGAMDEAVEAAGLESEDAAKALADLEAEIESSENPFIRQLMPSLGRAYGHHQHEVMRLDAYWASLSESE